MYTRLCVSENRCVEGLGPKDGDVMMERTNGKEKQPKWWSFWYIHASTGQANVCVLKKAKIDVEHATDVRTDKLDATPGFET